MSRPQLQAACLLLCLSLMLAACGKSGKPAADLSGTGKKSQVSGEVTGFGSVFINGTRYATDQLLIFVDDQPATESDLEVGMRVSLSLDTSGQPLALYFFSDLRGPVEETDAGTRSFRSLGQQVYIDELTAFDNITFDDITVTTPVTVSGARRADGSLLASYISSKASDQPTQITGAVSGHEAQNQQFTVNTLIVDYSQVAVFEVPNGLLSDGLQVRVQGMLESARLLASSVIAVEAPQWSMGDTVEISGLAQSPGSNQFQLEGRTIRTTVQTQWDQGDPADLQTDAYVEVLGEVINSTSLNAQRVRFRPPVNVEVEGELEAIDPENNTLRLLGTLEATLAPNVRIRDLSQQGQRTLDITRLNPGDRVMLSGYTLPDDSLFASRLDRLDMAPGEPVLIRGPVSRLNDSEGTFFIRNSLVQVGGNTDYSNLADRDEFFATVKAGDEVEVEGPYESSSQSVFAQRLSLVRSATPPENPPVAVDEPPANGNDGNNGQGDDPPANGNDGNNGQGDDPPANGNDGNNGQGDDPPANGNDGNNGQGDDPPANGNGGNSGRG